MLSVCGHSASVTHSRCCVLTPLRDGPNIKLHTHCNCVPTRTVRITFEELTLHDQRSCPRVSAGANRSTDVAGETEGKSVRPSSLVQDRDKTHTDHTSAEAQHRLQDFKLCRGGFSLPRTAERVVPWWIIQDCCGECVSTASAHRRAHSVRSSHTRSCSIVARMAVDARSAMMESETSPLVIPVMPTAQSTPGEPMCEARVTSPSNARAPQ